VANNPNNANNDVQNTSNSISATMKQIFASHTVQSLIRGISWTLIVLGAALMIKYFAFFFHTLQTKDEKIAAFSIDFTQFVEIAFALISSVLIDYYFSKFSPPRIIEAFIWLSFSFASIFAAIIEYFKTYASIDNQLFLASSSTVFVIFATAYAIVFRSVIFYFDEKPKKE
jgi:hypothetical protein